MIQTTHYKDGILAWRQELDASLRAENSWLALAGLHWLKEGVNSFGEDPSSDIVLPSGAAPGLAGSLELASGEVQMTLSGSVPAAVDGEPVFTAHLKPDSSGEAQLVPPGLWHGP